MWDRAERYIRYLTRARGRHGLHSPMAYKVLDEVYRRPPALPAELASYMRELKGDTRALQMEDHGAGSHILQEHTRTVDKLQKVAGSSAGQARILYGLAKELRPACILEFGTCLGAGTSALHLGAPQARLITVEADPTLHGIASKASPCQEGRVEFVNATFEEFLDSGDQPQGVDLFVLDGDHRYEPTMEYVRHVLPLLSDHACLILDDIRWSKGMFQAWEELCAQDHFQLSLDMGNKGLLFKLPHTVKQHFTLRNWNLR